MLEHVLREKLISILIADTNMKYRPEKTNGKVIAHSPRIENVLPSNCSLH